jgi:hypothetical protein
MPCWRRLGSSGAIRAWESFWPGSVVAPGWGERRLSWRWKLRIQRSRSALGTSRLLLIGSPWAVS